MSFVPYLEKVMKEAGVEDKKPSLTGNWILDQIMGSIQATVKGFIDKVVDIKKKIDSGDITGAIVEVTIIAIPAFLVFCLLDILCTKIGIGLFGFNLDLSGLKSILSQFFKVDLFVSAIIGAWVGAGLRSPMEQISNKIFRPSILSISSATQLRIRGKLSDTEWREILARYGVPDGQMKHILDLADKKPAEMTAMRMFQYIDYPDDHIRWFLKENDITTPEIQNLYVRYFHAVRLRDEMLLYKQYLLGAYLDGLLTDDSYKEQLALFKASKEEINQTLLDAQEQFDWNLTRNTIAVFTWYYRRGCYEGEEPEQDFYDDLIGIGINSATANAIVKLEAAKLGIVWELP